MFNREKHLFVGRSFEAEVRAWYLLSTPWDLATHEESLEIINEIREDYIHYEVNNCSEDKYVKDRLYMLIKTLVINISPDHDSLISNLLNAEEMKESQRCDVLSQIVPEVSLIIILQVLDDTPEKIKLLDHYLTIGEQIRPENMDIFIVANSDYPEIIRFYIQHDLCTTINLIHIFKLLLLPQYGIYITLFESGKIYQNLMNISNMLAKLFQYLFINHSQKQT